MNLFALVNTANARPPRADRLRLTQTAADEERAPAASAQAHLRSPIQKLIGYNRQLRASPQNPRQASSAAF